MRRLLVFFCLGVLSLRLLPILMPSWLLLALLLVSLLCWLKSFTKIVATFLLGLCWASWQAALVIDDQLSAELDGRTLWIEAQVADLPQWSLSSRGQRVARFELIDASSRRGKLPQKIRVSWYDAPQVKAGERWRLALNLKTTHGLLNPHAFDYQQWLTARRIGATGSVKAGELLASGKGLPAWREKLREKLLANLPSHEASATVLALVLGDGSAIERQRWQTLQRSGTVHLFVISGQHISLVAALAYGFIALLVRLGWWPARIAWLPIACVLAFFCATSYGLLAGFTVPVKRALIMVAVVLLWRMRNQQLASWTPWLLALFIILAWDPLVILQPGLWLSFAAVAVLMLVFAARLYPWPWHQLLVRAQLAAAIGLMPFLLALGLPVSSSGPLANLVAVPLVSFASLPLSLLGTLLLPWPQFAKPVLFMAVQSLHWLWLYLEQLVLWLPSLQPLGLPYWVLFFALLGSLLLLLPKALKPIWLVLVLFVPVFWPPETEQPAYATAKVWVLDVGQGLAIAIKTKNHTLLYDTGPAIGGMDAGEQIVVPFLRGEQVKHIDLIMLSHADADHAGGAAAVLENFKVNSLTSGEAHRHQAWGAQSCTAKSWSWDGVTFSQWQWDKAQNGNAASCVLWIRAGEESILLTGDLDVLGEHAMLNHWPEIKANWLLAGHHGSRTSTSNQLIQQLEPHTVIFSRGRYNNYGHPHPQVVKLVQNYGSKILDTAKHKAILIHLGKQQPAWTMSQQARFWRKNET